MTDRLKDKVAVITGAAQGIGRACAQLCAREGSRVVLADIQDEKGLAVADEIRSLKGESIYQHADVTSEKECSELIKSAIDNFGRIDILVNNAGHFPRATLEETSTELWDQVININLRGAFYCCKYAMPYMRHGGGGSVINIGSINGIQGLPTLIAYSSAKGGLLALTRTLAGAYAKDKIRVNYIIPGWVLTEGELAVHAREGTEEKALKQAGNTMPLGRQQTPEDIALSVVFLASDEASQITGAVLNIDAGVSTLPLLPTAKYEHEKQ
jgi:NAD(P)-dependent dehydrogenase (short-subunit alcohol dehydrogenase family)